ncbi:MAG TPA: ribbon-helix-helix protein, CopG family [Candidatus Dormibacteraeota bacterium]
MKVAISLPEDMLANVDRVRAARGESRSRYFRDAVEADLSSEGLDSIERYVNGYAAQPESAEEIAAARSSAEAILASEPWD